MARYTSAAPLFFTEFEDYVDGGVLANNPCESGLTAIQNFYRQKGTKLDIALVVSVGTGIFPPEELGTTNAQEFLFFGKHWFKSGDNLRKRAKKRNSCAFVVPSSSGGNIPVPTETTSAMSNFVPFWR